MNERFEMDERLRRAVQALPESIEPDRDLWPDLAARLDTGGDDDVRAGRPARRGFNPWHLAWPVAAVLAFAFVASPLLQRENALPPVFDEMAQDYDQFSTETRISLNSPESTLSEDDRAVLAANLSLLDAAVAETRDALRGALRAPGQALRLTAGFQKKIDLLERLAGRASRS
jgi:hypothetical protein